MWAYPPSEPWSHVTLQHDFYIEIKMLCHNFLLSWGFAWVANSVNNLLISKVLYIEIRSALLVSYYYFIILWPLCGNTEHIYVAKGENGFHPVTTFNCFSANANIIIHRIHFLSMLANIFFAMLSFVSIHLIRILCKMYNI